MHQAGKIDFRELSLILDLTNFQRVCVRTGKKAKAGPSTALRSGRDDNSFARKYGLSSRIWVISTTKLSSRPERTRISCHADLTNVHVCGFR